MDMVQFVCMLIGKWILEIMSKAAKTFMYGILCECKFLFHLGKYLRGRLLGHMVKTVFNFMNNCQTDIQSSCSMLIPT